ncbi:hypothetical protein [Rhodobacter calidifons]|uniref:Uncharacterized protein n=1 Tax=Rhodobacter calidifons TaxID=2715277 RepID=A0ABX0G4U4_9RHOB|nr:hypothetical protein [Rhodobacter calidifons]NHB76002.1 hypothetical protein [Rhodobacter calidifons]
MVEDELALAASLPEGEAPEVPQADAAGLVTNGRLDGLGRRIAVMGAQTRLDEAAARMVAQAMRAEGAEVEHLPPRAALPRALGDFRPETLVIVGLDGTSGTATDLLLRQMRRRLPGTRIGIALWKAQGIGTRPEPRGRSLADFQVTGMEDLFAAAFSRPTDAPALAG